MPSLPPDWFQLKKKYKKLIKDKKNLALKMSWQKLIVASRSHDSVTFWEIVSRGLDGQAGAANSYIPVKTWELYFTGLYAAKQSGHLTPQTASCGLPDWPPVSVSKITRLSLK